MPIVAEQVSQIANEYSVSRTENEPNFFQTQPNLVMELQQPLQIKLGEVYSCLPSYLVTAVT